MESEGRHSELHRHTVSVFVNDKAVELRGKAVSGSHIKTSAIEQGVHIKESFTLIEQLAGGATRVIGDQDEVQLHEGMKFAATAKEHRITVSVNEQPVTLDGKSANGAQIKSAAISQGVHIQANFILQEELPNGTSRVIGDKDVVHLREHLRFTAIAPDDNS